MSIGDYVINILDTDGSTYEVTALNLRPAFGPATIGLRDIRTGLRSRAYPRYLRPEG